MYSSTVRFIYFVRYAYVENNYFKRSDIAATVGKLWVGGREDRVNKVIEFVLVIKNDNYR